MDQELPTRQGGTGASRRVSTSRQSQPFTAVLVITFPQSHDLDQADALRSSVGSTLLSSHEWYL